jgi:predicted kinase
MLYIIRGAPGSGKSTLAERFKLGKLVDVHYEADQFMVNSEGEYEFDPTRLKECHAECLNHVRQAIDDWWNVAVSNTFTKIWEVKPYIDLCKETNTSYTIIRCEGDYGNTHGVPHEVVERMKIQYETYKE